LGKNLREGQVQINAVFGSPGRLKFGNGEYVRIQEAVTGPVLNHDFSYFSVFSRL
jgi:hypothetical protein